MVKLSQTAKNAMSYDDWVKTVQDVLIEKNLLIKSEDGTIFPTHDSPEMVHIIGHPITLDEMAKFSDLKERHEELRDKFFTGLRRHIPYAIITIVIVIIGLAHNITG